MRSKDLRRELENSIRYATRQADTIIVLRGELRRLQDLNEDYSQVVNQLHAEIARLNAQLGIIRAQLDEAHATQQTQAAFLREGYRSKTGEIL